MRGLQRQGPLLGAIHPYIYIYVCTSKKLEQLLGVRIARDAKQEEDHQLEES